MQEDGNLVIYDGDRPVWATNTSGIPGAFLQLDEGILTILSRFPRGRVVWQVGTENWP
jgi:hypothetical protein